METQDLIILVLCIVILYCVFGPRRSRSDHLTGSGSEEQEGILDGVWRKLTGWMGSAEAQEDRIYGGARYDDDINEMEEQVNQLIRQNQQSREEQKRGFDEVKAKLRHFRDTYNCVENGPGGNNRPIERPADHRPEDRVADVLNQADEYPRVNVPNQPLRRRGQDNVQRQRLDLLDRVGGPLRQYEIYQQQNQHPLRNRVGAAIGENVADRLNRDRLNRDRIDRVGPVRVDPNDQRIDEMLQRHREHNRQMDDYLRNSRLGIGQRDLAYRPQADAGDIGRHLIGQYQQRYPDAVAQQQPAPVDRVRQSAAPASGVVQQQRP